MYALRNKKIYLSIHEKAINLMEQGKFNLNMENLIKTAWIGNIYRNEIFFLENNVLEIFGNIQTKRKWKICGKRES